MLCDIQCLVKCCHSGQSRYCMQCTVCNPSSGAVQTLTTPVCLLLRWCEACKISDHRPLHLNLTTSHTDKFLAARLPPGVNWWWKNTQCVCVAPNPTDQLKMNYTAFLFNVLCLWGRAPSPFLYSLVQIPDSCQCRKQQSEHAILNTLIQYNMSVPTKSEQLLSKLP